MCDDKNFTGDEDRCQISYCGEFTGMCKEDEVFIEEFEVSSVIFDKMDGVPLLAIDLRDGRIHISDEMKNAQVEDIAKKLLEVLDNNLISNH